MKVVYGVGSFVLMLFLSGCLAADVHRVARGAIYRPTDSTVNAVKQASRYERQESSKGSVYVFWKTNIGNLGDSAPGINIYIDGTIAGALVKNSYTVIELDPGVYEISVGDKKESTEREKIYVDAGDDIYYRTGVRRNVFMFDELVLERYTDAGYAKKVIGKSDYVIMVEGELPGTAVD